MKATRVLKAESLLAVVLVLLIGCQKPSGSQRPAPSATELFNLRTKCSELGDKLLTLTPVQTPFVHEQTSRFDLRENRCYVDVFVHKQGIREPSWDDYTTETVFDGQTREALASVEHTKGEVSAWIKDGPDHPTGTQGILRIKALMSDDPEVQKAYQLSIAATSLQQP